MLFTSKGRERSVAERHSPLLPKAKRESCLSRFWMLPRCRSVATAVWMLVFPNKSPLLPRYRSVAARFRCSLATARSPHASGAPSRTGNTKRELVLPCALASRAAPSRERVQRHSAIQERPLSRFRARGRASSSRKKTDGFECSASRLCLSANSGAESPRSRPRCPRARR